MRCGESDVVQWEQYNEGETVWWGAVVWCGGEQCGRELVSELRAQVQMPRDEAGRIDEYICNSPKCMIK